MVPFGGRAPTRSPTTNHAPTAATSMGGSETIILVELSTKTEDKQETGNVPQS
jgi:hypothetical protein